MVTNINNENAYKSWEHFKISMKRFLPHRAKEPYIYRGQANREWKLESSLLRILQGNTSSVKKALSFELYLTNLFINKGEDHLRNIGKSKAKTDILMAWELMQHYGAPSRLLDWSHDPYTAIFFACSDLEETDGAFFIFSIGNLQSSQFIDNHPKISINEHYDELLKSRDKTFFLNLNASLNGTEHKEYISSITDPIPTNRMINQHAEFTISTEILEPHDITADRIRFRNTKVLGAKKPSNVQKIIVPKELKPEFLKRLDEEKGINSTSMYPDFDNTNGLDKTGELTREIAINSLELFL